MKERPILFSGPMVRAILDGRKTMTRRVIKPQPRLIEPSMRWYWEKALDVNGRPLVDASRQWWEYYGTSPYGKPGDQLWCRETWAPFIRGDGGDGYVRLIRFAADGAEIVVPPEHWAWWDKQENKHGYRGRPSIHMPRWASRLTLEIEEIRVERLQEISEEDAEAEGVEFTEFWPDAERQEPATGYAAGKYAFHALWDSINSKRGFGWDMNPHIWVIKFRRLTNDQR